MKLFPKPAVFNPVISLFADKFESIRAGLPVFFSPSDIHTIRVEYNIFLVNAGAAAAISFQTV